MNITKLNSNNKTIETFLEDYINEMELDIKKKDYARLTLTVYEDYGAYIEGTIGYPYESNQYIYEELYDTDLPTGSATIIYEEEEDDDTLEERTLDALAAAMID